MILGLLSGISLVGAKHVFSVWAPTAGAVRVRPINASWAPAPLSAAADGVWSAAVEGVKPLDKYVFELNGSDHPWIDPRCNDIALDGHSASVIPAPFVWSHPRVTIPPSHAIIYELMVGRFTPEGTFDAAIAKLPYLAELGFTVVELMPVMHSCGDEGVGNREWGYCPRAPYAVRPELGGAAGLRRFVDACAGLGMAVVLDLVWNHAAGDSLLKGWRRAPSGGRTTQDSAYFYTGEYSETPWGPRPLLSGRTLGGREFILGNVRMLIDEFHIGGFRWDSTTCIRKGGSGSSDPHCDTDNPDGWRTMQAANDISHSGSRAGTLTCAEDSWGAPYNNGSITAPTADLEARGPAGTAGGAGFDLAWGYDWHFEMVPKITSRTNAAINASRLLAICADARNLRSVLFSENHDVSSQQGPPKRPAGRIPDRSLS